jgi:CHAD domain-containing protein
MHTVESLCERHGVDMAHARFVADASVQLFDRIADRYQLSLSARARELLRAGGLLHRIALAANRENHHLSGRDIILAAPLRDFSPSERAVLACEVAFHEQEVYSSDELFRALTATQRREALVLSAILRVADALDHSATQTTTIAGIECEAYTPAGATVVRLRLRVWANGPHCREDAIQADRRADLLRTLLGEVVISARVCSPGLSPDISLAEAGRRVLAYRFDWSGGREAWERAVQAELSCEQVRKLRVTVRRMRADLRLFGSGYRNRALRPIGKGLRAWSGALRQVRLYDSLLDTVNRYRDRCDDEAGDALLPLLNEWQDRRAAAGAQLRALAQSDDGQVWLEAFEALLSGDGGREVARRPEPGEPSRVRHVVRVAVWQGIAGVRAFDVLSKTPNPSDLHALRLAVKRLRYTVEALGDVLPPDEARTWIARCVPAQDALGSIQDAFVAATQAQAYVAQHKPTSRSPQRVAVRGIVTFAEAQRKVIDVRVATWRDYLQPFL